LNVHEIGPPRLHIDRRRADLEIAPLAVEPIFGLDFPIDVEDIHIKKIGMVVRRCPGQISVVVVEEDRTAGEHSSNHIPSFFAVEMNPIPCQRAFPRLMGVGAEARLAVGGPERPCSRITV